MFYWHFTNVKIYIIIMLKARRFSKNDKKHVSKYTEFEVNE